MLSASRETMKPLRRHCRQGCSSRGRLGALWNGWGHVYLHVRPSPSVWRQLTQGVPRAGTLSRYGRLAMAGPLVAVAGTSASRRHKATPEGVALGLASALGPWLSTSTARMADFCGSPGPAGPDVCGLGRPGHDRCCLARLCASALCAPIVAPTSQYSPRM